MPALVVSGSLSTTSKVDDADAVAESFREPIVLRFPTLGFEPLDDGPQCLSDIRLRFLDDPRDQPSDTEIADCQADSPPIAWVG